MRASTRGTERVATVMREGRTRKSQDVRDAEALLEQAIALQGSIARGFWDLGRVLAELASRKLHVALGYGRFEDLVTARLGMSKSVAFRLIAVAGRLPKHAAVKLGQERAHALVVYAAASGEDVDPVALARSDAPIVGDRPLSQTPVREILAARPPRPKPLARRASEAADKKLVREVKRRLFSLGLRGVEVVAIDDRIRVALTRSQAERFGRS